MHQGMFDFRRLFEETSST